MRRDNGKISALFLLTFYDACLRETQFNKIVAACDVDHKTLRSYIQKYECMRLAKRMAEERRGSRETLANYVLGNLSPEAKEIWEELQFWEGAEDQERIDSIVGACSKKLRQELWLHALVKSGYNPSQACKLTGVARMTLHEWRLDPDFLQLVNEVQEHKKNFFEHALLDLVEMRNPSAVIFVNRTINKDRGYGEQIEIKTENSGDFNIDDLDLPLETRKQILQAIRKKKQEAPQTKQLKDATPIDV